MQNMESGTLIPFIGIYLYKTNVGVFKTGAQKLYAEPKPRERKPRDYEK
jgi:hypothetical protein